ncbi:hypothetical protein AX14_008071 [Amanita brunnescens Koide BX004]|nr:hypothetical protein AX14_008071 [Amanita brunnescens Koide BX004]
MFVDDHHRYVADTPATSDLASLPKGSHLSFSGAVWQDRPVIEPLTVAFPLHCHTTDEKIHIAFCRAISALRKALPALKACYDESGCKPDQALPLRWFPYPNTFRSLQNSEIHIDYNIPTAREKETFEKQLIFSATIRDTGRKVCVKFTRRYSREAHKYCADNGFAPELLGCDSLPGAWIMVVLECIDDDYISLFSAPTRIRTHGNLYSLIQRKLQMLHQRRMVHGDICDVNIMVQEAVVDKILLINFDGAGKIGEARYPINANCAVWRPADAVDRQFVAALHDMKMLGHIFGYAESNFG